MLKITKTSANRVEIALDGHVDAVEMAAGLDALIAESKDVTNGQLFYRITNFAMPSLSAFGVEITRLPSLFGLLGKYDRCAVLSDAAWLRTAAEVEGALIPGLAIKAFTPDQEDAAEAWLAA